MKNTIEEESSPFINKAKKQAKKILQIAKNNSNVLSISNLAQAQELISQINGYPNWYTLNTKFKSLENHYQNNNKNFSLGVDNIIFFNQKDNLFYINEGDDISTYFIINSLPSSREELTEMIRNFNKKCSFYLNMNIHSLEIIGNSCPPVPYHIIDNLIENISSQVDMSIDSCSEILNNYNNTIENRNNNLCLFLKIKSKNTNLDYHLKFCSIIKNNFLFVKDLEFLMSQEHNRLIMNTENMKSYEQFHKKEIHQSLFANNFSVLPELDMRKLIYIFNFLINSSLNLVFNINTSTLETTIYYDDNNENNKHISSIINSIIKTKDINFELQELSYHPLFPMKNN